MTFLLRISRHCRCRIPVRIMNIREGEKHPHRKNGVKVAQIQSGWKSESSHNAVRWILEHFPQEFSCLHLLRDAVPVGSALALETQDGWGTGC